MRQGCYAISYRQNFVVVLIENKLFNLPINHLIVHNCGFGCDVNVDTDKRIIHFQVSINRHQTETSHLGEVILQSQKINY